MPRPIHTAEQAIEFLHSRIDYERMSASLSASDFKLDRMRNLLNHLGNPQRDTPVVHIAGTKGKGSTAAMVSQILVEAGLHVGLFTSPHLDRFEERIRIGGIPIEADELVELVNEVAAATTVIDGEGGNLKPTFLNSPPHWGGSPSDGEASRLLSWKWGWVADWTRPISASRKSVPSLQSVATTRTFSAAGSVRLPKRKQGSLSLASLSSAVVFPMRLTQPSVRSQRVRTRPS